jgi:hypothetical protein
MKTVDESFQSAIATLSNLRKFFLTTSAVDQYQIVGMPAVSGLIQFHPKEPYNREHAVALARAIGGDWKINRDQWRGQALGFEVVIHQAEKCEKDPVKVEL